MDCRFRNGLAEGDLAAQSFLDPFHGPRNDLEDASRKRIPISLSAAAHDDSERMWEKDRFRQGRAEITVQICRIQA